MASVDLEIDALSAPALDGWEQISAGRPRLKEAIDVIPQIYRGEIWFLLYDPLTTKNLLLDEKTFALASGFDGLTSLAAQIADSETTDQVQQDLISLVYTLREQGMLTGEFKAQAETTQTKKPWYLRAMSLFSLKVPLFDPDILLEKWRAIAALALSAPSAIAYCLLVAAGIFTALYEWAEITQHFAARFFDPANVFWLILLYPLLKLLHEFGHGLVAKHFGAEVHEMGVIFLVFFPVPYVDASATVVFEEPRHRMLVAGAGILVELGVSAIGLILWSYSSPGLLGDLCFNLAILGGVSTLMFNGNPLLRFDGYYVLSDYLQSPNLGPRSTAYVGALSRKWLFGLAPAKQRTLPGEANWLLVYGLASMMYRLFVGITIAIYVAGRFFAAGLVLACWFVLIQIIRPLVQFFATTRTLARQQAKLGRFVMSGAAIFVIGPLFLFFMPIPHSTLAWGVILPPETALVRTGVAGFARSNLPEDGRVVAQDELLLQLDNIDLQHEARIAEIELRMLHAELREKRQSSPVEASVIRDDILLKTNALRAMTREVSSLDVRSNQHGTFSGLLGRNPEGRWLARGTLVGVVTGAENWVVRAMLPQAMAYKLREDLKTVKVVSLAEPARRMSGTLLYETPEATWELPNRTLGSASGGPIPVDNTDEQGLRLLEPMVEVHVALPAGQNFVGQTVSVRFVHGTSPLGPRGVRWLVSTLQRFVSNL